MKQRLDRAARRLVLEFSTDQELEDFVAKRDDFGWTVRLEERLEEGDELSVVLAGDTNAFLLETRIQQIFRSGLELFGTILEVASKKTISRESALPEEADSETTGPDTRIVASEVLGTSPIFEIKKLKGPQKVRLAAKANRQQRQILLRESSPQVAMSLLNNPQIETKEVAVIVKNPQVAGGVLQRIARDRRFNGNYEIQLALVKNPQTPTPLAIRFIDHLHKGDLRDLAKSQALRENIRRAILRVYLQRS